MIKYINILPVEGGATVIDVGMNVGYTSLFFASKKWVNEVYSYELFKPTYDEALVNFSLNREVANKIHSFNYGLSDNSYVKVLDYSSTNRGRVGLDGVSRVRGIVSDVVKEKVCVRSAGAELGRIINEKANKRFIILKIDTEGSEKNILDSLNESNLLRRVDFIIVEVHSTYILEIIEENFVVLNQVPFNGIGMIYAFNSRGLF